MIRHFCVIHLVRIARLYLSCALIQAPIGTTGPSKGVEVCGFKPSEYSPLRGDLIPCPTDHALQPHIHTHLLHIVL